MGLVEHVTSSAREFNVAYRRHDEHGDGHIAQCREQDCQDAWKVWQDVLARGEAKLKERHGGG